MAPIALLALVLGGYAIAKSKPAAGTPAAAQAAAPVAQPAPPRKKKRSFWQKLGRAFDPTIGGSITSRAIGKVL